MRNTSNIIAELMLLIFHQLLVVSTQNNTHIRFTCLLFLMLTCLKEPLEYMFHCCGSNIVTSVYQWRSSAAFVHKMIHKVIFEVSSINHGTLADNTAVIGTLDLGTFVKLV